MMTSRIPLSVIMPEPEENDTFWKSLYTHILFIYLFIIYKKEGSGRVGLGGKNEKSQSHASGPKPRLPEGFHPA